MPTDGSLKTVMLKSAPRQLKAPPPGMFTRFLELFEEKAAVTDILAGASRKELGW